MNTETRPVQLTDYLAAVRRRWRVVVLVTVLVTGAALTVSLLGTKQYDARAQLLFRDENEVESLIDPSGGQSLDPERALNTDVELIKLDAIAEAVRRRARLDVSTEALLEQVETETSNQSNIVSLVARDVDPRTARDIANGFADEYVAYRRRSARANLLEAAAIAENEYQSLTPEDQASPEGQQLGARRRQLRITAALQTGGVEVIRRAKEPSGPSRPRPKLSGALGLMLGLALGIAVALVLQYTDRRLRREEDVEAIFDLPVLASIPHPPRRGGDDHAEREAFGMLAANLRFSAVGRDSSVVMITSPSPAEGKTSVTLGLARALAQLGLRVIAIEADLRRPTFAHKAPIGPSAGLAGLIAEPGPIAPQLIWLDAATLLPVTEDSVRDGLTFAVLPAGGIPPHPQRLLSRPTMGSIIEQARSLADVVVVDTPPIGTVNDAATLAPIVDSAVIVVRLGHTTKDGVRRALRGLRGLDVDLTGLAITDATEALRYDYYRASGDATTPDRGQVARS